MRLVLAAVVVLAVLAACSERYPEPEPSVSPTASSSDAPSPATPAPAASKLATFGGGCFWCTEAVFGRLGGVISVQSGYAGGTKERPTYKEVCAGTTGHAEVVQVRYDPSRLAYEDLLEVFWKTHDPTTPDRQGADVGTQYRSVVFHHDDEQRAVAEDLKARLDAAKVFSAPIVTQIVPYDRFWPAEAYHQDYYADNPSQPYCRAVIAPKLEKLEKVFKDRLKK